MPAVSRAQRIAMVIAEHHPSKLFSRNASLKKMSKAKLHEFTSTSEKGLPAHIKRDAIRKGLGQ